MEPNYESLEALNLTLEQRRALGFLAELVKQMVALAFSEQMVPAKATNLIKEIYQVSDDLITEVLGNGKMVACDVGCYWCCLLRVKVTPLELLHIVDYVNANLKPGELTALRQRLERTDQITRGMDGYQRIKANMSCPLLVKSRCLAYPARPLACRFFHSLSNSDCELLFVNQGTMMIRRDISDINMAIFAGLTEGLRTVGLQARILELTAGLRIFLDEPELAENWLSGDSVLVEAEINSAEKIENFHRALIEEFGNSLHRNRVGQEKY